MLISAVACLFIIFVTVAGGIYFFPKLSRARRELDEAFELVRETEQNGRVRTVADLESFSENLNKFDVLKITWSEYEETIVKEHDSNIEGGGFVFNTVAFEKFATWDEVVAKQFNKDILLRYPSIITSLGLALTFIFIAYGLNALHVKDDGAIDGIGSLINSLSSKFLASIAALICSIIFGILEGTFISDLEKSYRRLAISLDQCFRRKTEQEYLREIASRTSESRDLLQKLTFELADTLKKGVSAGLSEALQPTTTTLIQALSAIQSEKKESISETMKELVGEFRTAMTGAAGSEIKDLSENLKSLVNIIRDGSETSSESNRILRQTADQLAEQAKAQREISGSALSEMQDRMTKMVISMNEAIERQATSQSQSLQRLDGESTQVIERVKESIEALVRNVSASTEKSNASSAELVKALTSQMQHMTDSLDSLTKRQSTASEQASLRMHESTEHVVRSLQAGSITAREESERALKVFSSMQEEMTKALGIFRSAVEEGTQLNESSRSVQEVLNKSVEACARIQDDGARNLRETLANVHEIKTTQAAIQIAIDQQQRVLKDMQHITPALVKQMNDSLIQYSGTVKSQLEKYLTTFDSQLSDATKSLGDTVQNIDETLDTLASKVLAFSKKTPPDNDPGSKRR